LFGRRYAQDAAMVDHGEIARLPLHFGFGGTFAHGKSLLNTNAK